MAIRLGAALALATTLGAASMAHAAAAPNLPPVAVPNPTYNVMVLEMDVARPAAAVARPARPPR